MSECEGCGAPVRPALMRCDYCRREYPHATRTFDMAAYLAMQQQQCAVDLYNAYSAQMNCANSASLYSMLGAQQNNPMRGFNNYPGQWP